MSKIWDAICKAGFEGKIKVSTAVKFDVFKNTYRPSKAEFLASYMYPVVNFLVKTGNPIFAKIYPFFAYKGNPQSISLDCELFRLHGTAFEDPPYKYQNLFDAMVDSVYCACLGEGWRLSG